MIYYSIKLSKKAYSVSDSLNKAGRQKFQSCSSESYNSLLAMPRYSCLEEIHTRSRRRRYCFIWDAT